MTTGDYVWVRRYPSVVGGGPARRPAVVRGVQYTYRLVFYLDKQVEGFVSVDRLHHMAPLEALAWAT